VFETADFKDLANFVKRTAGKFVLVTYIPQRIFNTSLSLSLTLTLGRTKQEAMSVTLSVLMITIVSHHQTKTMRQEPVTQ
jgi:hypothetical protein